MRGRNCLKYLKRGWVEQNRGEGTQRFLKGGAKLGQGVAALKRGWDWNHRTNYVMYVPNVYQQTQI